MRARFLAESSAYGLPVPAIVRADDAAQGRTMPNLKYANLSLPRELTSAPPLAHTIPDAVRISGIGRSKLYELIRSGALDARKLGGRTLIPAKALRALIDSLPRVGGQ